MCLCRHIHAHMLMEGICDILPCALVHVAATAGIWFSEEIYRNFFIVSVGNHLKSKCVAGVLIL